MFRCVECNYQGPRFNVKVAGIKDGHLVYEAICPSCGDEKVIPIGKCRETDLTIGPNPNNLLQRTHKYSLPNVNLIDKLKN